MDRLGDFLKDNLPESNAQRVVRALQKAYDGAYSGLGADQELHLEYHSPAGEVFRVRRMVLDPSADAWLIDGRSKHTGEWSRVFAPINVVHVVLRVVTIREGEQPERKRIGFTISENETTT